MSNTLAPAYRNIVAGLRLFRPAVPTPATLPQLRAKTSEWISRWRLPLSHDVPQAENTQGWTIFKPAAETQGHVFYLHGGGLVFYSVEDFSSLMMYLAAASRCTLTAFRYAKAPEHDPNEIVDLVAASMEKRLRELQAEPVTLAGDSIGGYIALMLALRRISGRFSRLVLIYPVLDIDHQRPSYATYGRGYCLNADMMRWFQSLWHAKDDAGRFSPFHLTDKDIRNLPETLVVSAEMDILRDEAFEWCAALRAQELPVTHHHMPALAHDFCLHAGAVPEAREAIDFIAGRLRS
ncbi:MAG TPA: alpha/beta hydrolase [Candidatus Angelobacter sp.]